MNIEPTEMSRPGEPSIIRKCFSHGLIVGPDGGCVICNRRGPARAPWGAWAIQAAFCGILLATLLLYMIHRAKLLG